MDVLLVEDDLILRRLLAVQLSQLGYTVHETYNGEEAWALLQSTSISLVVSDWLMPELDGVGLIQRIRKSTMPRYIYVILLTGLDSETDLVAGIEAGADDYLTKPVRVRELAARIGIGKRILALEAQLRSVAPTEPVTPLRDLSSPLTLLLNRNAVMNHIEQRMSQYQVAQTAFSLALLDMDGLLEVNDTYGFQVGDRALGWLIEHLQTELRGSDSIGRYGADEFLVVLPGASAEAAMSALERVRQKLHANPMLVDGQVVAPTFSAGITTCSLFTTSAAVLFQQADSALQQAKAQGRGQTCIFSLAAAEDQTLP